MTIDQKIEVFTQQYDEIRAKYPAVSAMWFEITDIPYNEFVSYCEENGRTYEADSTDRLRAIAKIDSAWPTVWIYTKRLSIKKSIQVTELVTEDQIKDPLLTS